MQCLTDTLSFAADNEVLSLNDIKSLQEPISELEPSGPDLAYDPKLLELERVANAVDEEQSPSSNEWLWVINEAKHLLHRTKDLRVAVILLRGLVACEGWHGLSEGLAVLRGMLERYWLSVHPRLTPEENNDPTWRLNILADLGDPAGLVHDLLLAPLFHCAGSQYFTLRDLECAFDKAAVSKDVNDVSCKMEETLRGAEPREAVQSLVALEESTWHLTAIEAQLLLYTNRGTDPIRTRLINTLERTYDLVKRTLQRGDLAIDLANTELIPTDLSFEILQDYRVEQITEKVPALFSLLETRKELWHTVQIIRNDKIPAFEASNTGADAHSTEQPITTVDEDVQFTVYRPRSIVTGLWYTLLAFAHLSERRENAPNDEPDPVEEVHRQAMSVLGDDADKYQTLTEDTSEAIPEHGLITFVPYVPGIEFNPARRTFRWAESVHREEFRMRADTALTGSYARGRLSVFLGSILIGEVNLNFRVIAERDHQSKIEQAEASRAHPYRKIFPSYAHGDTAIVEQFEQYAKSLGDAYLRDVTTLRAGEVWNERIGELIAYADIFQLFWSTRSIVSPFVRSEWERALALKRDNFIRPVYWENPLPELASEGLPPLALRQLHFQRIAWALPAASTKPRSESINSGLANSHLEHETYPQRDKYYDDDIRETLNDWEGEERINAKNEEIKPERPKSIHEKLLRIRRPYVHLRYEVATNAAKQEAELPFVMGVMADLVGNPNVPLPMVVDRKFLVIDEDNFEERMKSLKPRVLFTVPNALVGNGNLMVDLTFEKLSDFTPEAIVRKMFGPNSALKYGVRLSAQINTILHHEDFQKLESTWRGLYYLVSHTESGTTLKIRVLSISKAELARSLRQYKGVAREQGPIFRKLYEEFEMLGGEPYGCLMGDYYFDHSPQDVELLTEMSEICSDVQAPFIAGASPAIMHMNSWQDLASPRDLTIIFKAVDYAAWRAFRESNNARFIALTMPRFLSRLPYRAKSNQIEGFDFEEDTTAGLSAFTWANSAYIMVANINRAFSMYGWCARIQGVESGGAVEDLPVHTFPADDGGIAMTCSTEIDISDRREIELQRNGFIPLVHNKNRNFAVFFGAQSVQKPPQYDHPGATADAFLATRLPYLFGCCRFAHYVRTIYRVYGGMFKDRDDIQNWLQKWILGYVDSNPSGSSEDMRAKCPLADAEVIIEENDDSSPFFMLQLYLHPYYQLEGLTDSLRLDVKLGFHPVSTGD